MLGLRAQAGDRQADTPAKGGTSRFKGVSWSSRSRKWRSQLWFSSNVRRWFALRQATVLIACRPHPVLAVMLLAATHAMHEDSGELPPCLRNVSVMYSGSAAGQIQQNPWAQTDSVVRGCRYTTWASSRPRKRLHAPTTALY